MADAIIELEIALYNAEQSEMAYRREGDREMANHRAERIAGLKAAIEKLKG